MDDKEYGDRLKKGVGTPELWKLRRNTAITVGRGFHAAGEGLLLAVDMTAGVSVDARLTFEEDVRKRRVNHQKLVFQAF
jgi:hypothetical protein